MQRIAVIGSGLSSLSFVNSLIKHLPLQREALEIIIFDERKSFGKGMAYGEDAETNILNTKASYLTYDSTKRGDFYDWLNENKHLLQKEYRLDLSKINQNSFLPRSLFGKYICSKWDGIFTSFFKNLKIYPFYSKVKNIKLNKNNHYKYSLKTETDSEFHVNNIILATGPSNRKFDIFENNPNFITAPYKTKKLPSRIQPHENVLVMGSRLSAIDSIIALKESGHHAKIFMHCIAGTFPTVRGTQAPYRNKFLCKQYIREKFGSRVFIKDIICLYQQEFEYYLSQAPNNIAHENIMDIYQKFPIADLEEFISNEICASKKERPWQAILYDTNRSLPDVWNMLTKEEQEWFMKEYFNKFMGVRVSIPLENAKKILRYIQNGSLEFSHGFYDIEPEGKEIYFNAESNGHARKVQKVIFCTGSPANLVESDSPFLKNLIESDLVISNQLGGVEVTEKYNVINAKNEIDPDFFALGELIRGKFLFVSAVDLIYLHGERCGKIFADKFFKKNTFTANINQEDIYYE